MIERRNGQYHLPADIDRLYMLRKKTQPEANNDKILISVKEACELTGLSEKTMRSLMNENCFMVRIGRRTLIDKKKFQKWIDRQSFKLFFVVLKYISSAMHYHQKGWWCYGQKLKG